MLYYITLQYIILYYTILYYIMLCYIILYYIIWYDIILYYHQNLIFNTKKSAIDADFFGQPEDLYLSDVSRPFVGTWRMPVAEGHDRHHPETKI